MDWVFIQLDIEERPQISVNAGWSPPGSVKSVLPGADWRWCVE